MKPRNTIMALIAKNDPARYHTRSVEAEQDKLQKNRARRREKERREENIMDLNIGVSSNGKDASF